MGTGFSLSKSASSLALGVSEIALLVFGVVLVIGLIGEYAKSEKWKRRVRLFELLVIVGVAGELIADGGVFLFSSHLQTISDGEIAVLRNKASQEELRAAGLEKEAADTRSDAAHALERAAKAEENLGNARRDAAMANERAANAEKQAAEANLALVKLKVPRVLSPEQLSRIKLAVQEFPGTPFDLYAAADLEATELATQIEDALLSAGWTEIDTPGLINLSREGKKPIGIALGTGISVEINQSRLNDLLSPHYA